MSYSPLNLLRVPQNWLVNLDECVTGACSPRPLPGVPIFWSPGNQHIIIYRDFSGNDPTANIFLADGHGENVRPVATGYQPFWLDNDHFGYFQPNSATGIVDMMFGDVHTGESVLGLSHTELVPLIDDGPADASYFMTWAVARPQSDHQLSLLIIQDRGVTSPYLILNLQWDTGWPLPGVYRSQPDQRPTGCALNGHPRGTGLSPARQHGGFFQLSPMVRRQPLADVCQRSGYFACRARRSV